MMSTRPCASCKKTVYVNEKMDAEGRWYHRPCFKCQAPNCNTPLTLRNFQMAALDDSILDEMTGRPMKSLVCKDHVPMPKHSLNADALSVKHTTSVPKPSIPGLHRAFMGDRGMDGNGSSEALVNGAGGSGVLHNGSGSFLSLKTAAAGTFGGGGVGSVEKKVMSPRSLDQGSHGMLLKEMEEAKAREKAHHQEQQNLAASSEDHHDDHHSSTPTTSSSTSLPKFRHGRFTVSASESATKSSAASASTSAHHLPSQHLASEDAQDPTKDDDSFRNIPVCHGDYESLNENASGQDHVVSSISLDQDHKQDRVFTTKGPSISHSRSQSTSSTKVLEVSLETPEDVSTRAKRSHLSGLPSMEDTHFSDKDMRTLEAAETKAPQTPGEDKKLVEMAFSSKLMGQHPHVAARRAMEEEENEKAVEEDEWDAPPQRHHQVEREPVAGM